MAPSLPSPPKSHPLGTNEQHLPPIIKTAVEHTSPLKLVIKTPVYQNLAAFFHNSRTQLPNIHPSNSSLYSASATIIFPFPNAEQIAFVVIESIIRNFHCKTALETFIRKNNLLKFRSHIINKIQLMHTITPSQTYRTLDKIVIACLRKLGF